ncbi:MAG: anti-sigma factor [Brucellaceae bacterium]|nr:anti-sigma factor [Brucellaceae bacterium]
MALLDGELGAAERSKTIGALLADPAAAVRLRELDRAGQSWTEAFDALARAAPRDRLESRLRALPDRSGVSARWHGRPFRAARMAAAAALLLVAGALADRALLYDRAAPPGDVEQAGDADWREAVANYFALYTAETLSGPAVNLDTVAFGRLSAALGLDLTREQVALPDISLERTVLYSYDGMPLAQIAYLDPAAGPLAFCIVSGIEGEQPLMAERRAGMNIVFWSKGGLGYLVIGHGSSDRLAQFASLLSGRI